MIVIDARTAAVRGPDYAFKVAELTEFGGIRKLCVMTDAELDIHTLRDAYDVRRTAGVDARTAFRSAVRSVLGLPRHAKLLHALRITGCFRVSSMFCHA